MLCVKMLWTWEADLLQCIAFKFVILSQDAAKTILEQQLLHHGPARHKAATILIYAAEVHTDNGKVANSPHDNFAGSHHR